MFTLAAHGYDLFIYGLAVPELLNEPGREFTKHGAGYIGSLTLIGMCVGLLVVGPLTDRIGRRSLMMIGVAWFSVGSLVSASATSPEFLGAARVFTGIGLGGVIPCTIALTSEFAPRNRRELYNGVMLVGSSLGAIVASLVGLRLLPDYGARSSTEVAHKPAPDWVARQRLRRARRPHELNSATEATFCSSGKPVLVPDLRET